MGALHEGHRTLVRAARERAASVVVSVFVNPTQFGPGEDFDRYPRTWDADLAALAEEGADLVFHPGVDDVYPPGALGVTVDPGPLGRVLEGAVRPGHFAGVLTVVAKLFGLVRPDVALFGEKDYQQLTLIRAMARELALGVEVVGVPTVREDDGMALSSRNRYLDPEQRAAAVDHLGRAAGRGRRRVRTAPTRCWPPRGPCWPANRACSRTTSSSPIPISDRRPPPAPPACWSPPAPAPPDSSTTSP